jgi:lipopolysaccharide export system permease protein
MRILDRYVAATVIKGSLLTLFVLVAIGAFFTFLGQLGDLERAYGVLQAVFYVLLTIPRQAYEIFPTAVLLGSLLSLGNLAANSELVVMRAAGLSVKRVAWSVMQGGFLLMVFAAALGELVAPGSEQYAQNLRTSALSGYITLQSEYGFWARDGSSFVNIRRVLPGARLEDIYIYDYGPDEQLRSVTHAASAQYHDGKWLLDDIRESQISVDRVTTRVQKSAEWRSLLNPELLDVLSVDPEDLSAWSLYKYVAYLKNNNLDAKRYQLAFWVKVVTPLSTLVMLLITVPFVFGPLRSSGAGLRILVGVMVGMGFYLMNQTLNRLGIVYGLSPLISAVAPSLLFAVGGLLAMKKVK